MTTVTSDSPGQSASRRVALKIASRELKGGFKGFTVYLACLALGAFAIAATGSVTQSFQRGLLAEQRTLLGGDLQFTVVQRRASDEERAWMADQGPISESVTLNVMGEANGKRRQVDVRGVDKAHPLIGAPLLSLGDTDLHRALAKRDGVWGGAATASTLAHFDLAIGDRIQLGAIEVEIRTQLDRESDGLGEAGTFGPAVTVSLASLIEAGRLTNGQLFRARYRLTTNNADDGAVRGTTQAGDQTAAKAIAEKGEELWGDKGLRARLPADAVDGMQDLLAMLNSFLSVIGVAALVAGGVGVAQATSAFLQSRIASIAAFKALGANTGLIRASYAMQLGGLAALGASIGVVLGALTPFGLYLYAGDRIPLPQILGVYPGPLIQAFVLSLLAAALFALPALGRASATPPAALFRKLMGSSATTIPRPEKLLTLVAAVLLVSIAALTSPRPLVTFSLLIGAAGAYLILTGAAFLIRRGARAVANQSKGLRRLAMANLGGPGSLAPTIAPALGLGLALLTLVAVVQANLLRQVSETAPENGPSLFFSQIPGDAFNEFDAILAEQGVAIDDPDAFRRAPQMIGRVISLKNKPLVVDDVAESERWVVDGEIGLTYLAEKPPEAALTAGEWWPADYQGRLLVSIEEDAAKGMGLAIDDEIGFRIFGREVTAKVASFRDVDWGSFGANRAFIFSPGTLEAARPQHFAIARTTPTVEGNVIDALGEALPDVVVFQTSAFFATVTRLLGNISLAINAAASVVTLAGLLVLIGAFAAMSRKRRAEAALLKTFGASKKAILALYAGEFAIAGAVAALLGALMGTAAAYPIVINVFEAVWRFPWGTVLGISSFAVIAAAIGGGATGAIVLAQPPARVLKSG